MSPHLGDLLRDAVVQGAGHRQVETELVELGGRLGREGGAQVRLHVGGRDLRLQVNVAVRLWDGQREERIKTMSPVHARCTHTTLL